MDKIAAEEVENISEYMRQLPIDEKENLARSIRLRLRGGYFMAKETVAGRWLR